MTHLPRRRVFFFGKKSRPSRRRGFFGKKMTILHYMLQEECQKFSGKNVDPLFFANYRFSLDTPGEGLIYFAKNLDPPRVGSIFLQKNLDTQGGGSFCCKKSRPSRRRVFFCKSVNPPGGGPFLQKK